MPLTSKQKNTRKRPRRSTLQKKIILLLLTGITLGLTRNPNQYFRVAREAVKEWENIEKRTLERSINSLYKSKLVEVKDNRNGTLTLALSKEGKHLALTYDIEKMDIKSTPRWDRKWRIVMFDVPEKFKLTRDSIRMHLKSMGFYEFQKSVFVHPYPCAKEIEHLTEFYDAHKFMRFIIATEIDNSTDLKQHFNIA